MGCGCAGSTDPRQRQTRTAAQPNEKRQPRSGSPGQPGYYWSGPSKRSAAPVDDQPK